MTLDLERLRELPSHPLEEGPRHVIKEGTEILGGVLPTRTNIVVDTHENPDHYTAVMEEIDERLGHIDDAQTFDVLRVTEAVAAHVLPYDDDDYRELLKSEAMAKGVDRLGAEDYVGLSKFMFIGGICHQQALLEGAMLRLLQQRGDIGGSVSLAFYYGNPEVHTKVVFTEEDRDFILVGGGQGVWPEGTA